MTATVFMTTLLLSTVISNARTFARIQQLPLVRPTRDRSCIRVRFEVTHDHTADHHDCKQR
jgi:hypothetical protein